MFSRVSFVDSLPASSSRILEVPSLQMQNSDAEELQPTAGSGTGPASSTLSVRTIVNSSLLVYYQNVDGLNACAQEYLLATSDCSYDIIAFCETKLDDRTLSCQIIDQGYEVFRCDRSHFNSRKASGGGVLVAVRRTLKARVVENTAWRSVEQIWVEIRLGNRKLFVCVVYFPPDRTNDCELISHHIRSVEFICGLASPVDDVAILGDFNLPGLSWHATPQGYQFTDAMRSRFTPNAAALLDCYSTATLRQINGVRNENDRILDLCFVSESDQAPCVLPAVQPLVKFVRHHPALMVTIETTEVTLENEPARVSYNFNRGDYDTIASILREINWDDILDSDDVDRAVQTFSNVLAYVIDRHIPKRIIDTAHRKPWVTKVLRRLKTQKRAALRKYSKHRTLSLKIESNRINHVYQKTCRRSYKRYQLNLQRNLKRHPKSFWKYVRSQRKEEGLPTTMSLGEETSSDKEDICRMFAKKFSSVFTNRVLPDEQIASATIPVPSLASSIGQFEINEDQVMIAASRMKLSTNPGPDGIPSILLKKCAPSLLKPLQQIFQLSLTTGRFPQLWKTVAMFPVHKKGDKRNVDNYRGISSLCAVSKLFELVVMDPVFSFFKHYISSDQHGFMPQRSTSTNLLTFCNYAVDNMTTNSQTDVIYTDLTAAFDKIHHDIAISKLAKLGVTGSLLSWFESYLKGRELYVSIGNCNSLPFAAPSGIPQGSHLGPLVFLVYFNDIFLVLEGPRASFADDLKIYFKIRSIDDAAFLQRQLDVVASWCCTNCMLINPAKCTVVTFTRMKKPIVHDYHLSNAIIPRQTEIKDLGVVLDTQLSFKQHVSYVVAKASRNLGFVMRIAKNFSDVYCLKSLYCALVRSTLEYASAIWSPYYQNGAARIESVQRRFIRFALRFLPWRDPYRLPSYESRCLLIHLDTLQSRRCVSKALFVADLMSNRIDCPELLSIVDVNVPPRTLRRAPLLRPPPRRTNYGLHSAMSGLQRAFNSVTSAFDFNISRNTLKERFMRIVRLS